MRITTRICLVLVALSTSRVRSETQGRDWNPDVEGMNHHFETFMRDVISRSEKDPYIEHDFYEHVINLPISTNTACFDVKMATKREMVRKTRERLEYCKTNETAFLQLAVHLGLLQEISTNMWYTEGIQAQLIDNKEADMRRIKKGLPPRSKPRYVPYPIGASVNAWELRWKKIRLWNNAVREYRRGILEDLRQSLLDLESRLGREKAQDLRLVFPRAARLTEKETEYLFGPLPENDRIPLPPAP